MITNNKECFVVMPISDAEGYESGHFHRVYEHLIAPACKAAGYIPVRADDVKSTNHIVLDILQRIVSSDLVICDLSSKNPNVMYELGIRQAFDLPVVLIKDSKTDRVFDIQGIRTIDYDETLRVDRNNRDIESIRVAVQATMARDEKGVNSMIRLLGVASAVLPAKADISADTAMILKGLGEISQRLTKVEEQRPAFNIKRNSSVKLIPKFNPDMLTLPNGEDVVRNEILYDGNGNLVGHVWDVTNDGVILRDRDDVLFSLPPDNEIYSKLTKVPF